MPKANINCWNQHHQEGPNTKVGKEKDNGIVDKYGVGLCNACKEKIDPLMSNKWTNNNQHVVSRTCNIQDCYQKSP